MGALPTGTVTFLFTDVEGSTLLLAELGAEAYAAELDAHRRVLRSACAASGGVEVDAQGDALFVAFSRAADAVAAAASAQAALADGRLRVRMGIHTGEPLVTGEGYVGMDVHRAARIAAVGHGGQILASQATRDLVPDGEFVDLGGHRLKDLTRPERLYQLGCGGFPPLRSLNRTNLPVAAHPLVDRADEQAELAALLATERLVTITGPGGTGKTRLALQVAADAIDDFPDGVFFVPLGGVSDSALVVPAVRQVLGAGDETRVPVAAGRALVVLDNFEHLPRAAPAVAELLAQDGAPKLLVTSRTPLHVTAECAWALDPLAENPSIELFLDRARAVGRRLEPDATVARICRKLDGLPLALELAAARLKLLGPAALLERLDERLPLLTHGPLDLPERQRTLEATIAWSYELLEPKERRLFVRLSLFAGSFELEAAETVVDADVDTLAGLVDASLVKPLDDGRFLLLETIREFGRSRLAESEREELSGRHASHYAELAAQAEPRLFSAEAREWVARLDAEHANLRAALDRLVEHDPARAARLASHLWRYWLLRGHFDEAVLRLEWALAARPGPRERAQLEYQLGSILLSRGDAARARDLFEGAFRRFTMLGDRLGEARALAALGHAETDARSWQEARALYERAAALLRELGEPIRLAAVLSDLATLLLRSGRSAEALAAARQSLELVRRVGDDYNVALALATHGYALLATGDGGSAAGSFGEAARLCHRIGYAHGLVYALNGIGLLACARHEVERAARAFSTAQRLRRSIGIRRDSDDVLVAEARATVERELGRRCDDGTEGDVADLDAAVAACLAELPPLPA
jgi:predicted ATPase/class 3 adenylate cyclase